MKNLLLIIILITGFPTFGQVGINNDGSSPDSTAMLDVKSTTKGVLFPRMTTVQILAIANPVAGLLVFNTDKNRFYFYDPGVNGWKQISSPGSGALYICGNQFTDSRNGKIYNTIQIGDQCWMKENLNIGTRIDGTAGQTNDSVIEKYCYNNAEDSCDVYGGLYQWDEMIQYTTLEGSQGICPDGWHIPSDAEWCTLENAVDNNAVSCTTTEWRGIYAGDNLKETDTIHWYPPNTGATNSSGFTAMPGGARIENGTFGDVLLSGYFWSSTSSTFTEAWDRMLSYMHADSYRGSINKTRGLSVRCIKN